jgi:transcriptional regulator BetI-like protein
MAESWHRLRQLWDAAIEAEPDPRLWAGAMGQAYFEAKDPKVRCADLWVQALTEASDDPVIRKFLRKQMREVHDYVSGVIARSQEAGGIYPDRDASAEAWIFIAIGLLGTVGRRVGGLIQDEFPAIIASRRRWLTGIDETPDISDALDI